MNKYQLIILLKIKYNCEDFKITLWIKYSLLHHDQHNQFKYSLALVQSNKNHFCFQDEGCLKTNLLSNNDFYLSK
jgi:hypothetical protein